MRSPLFRFRTLLLRLGFLASALAFAGAGPSDARSQPSTVTLPGVLRFAGRYVTDYQRQLSAVVSEETYVQHYTRPGMAAQPSRRLRSDMLVVSDVLAGWLGFRDVFEVDGTPVRDRDERLRTLFTQPGVDAYEHARRITTESARYNLVEDVVRTINIPIMALRFLEDDLQSHSRFKLERVSRVDDAETAIISFEERQRPRLIRTTDGAAARGRFWIDPLTGRVLRSELRVDTSGSRHGQLAATVRATYAYVEKIGMFVPVTMDEEYRATGLVVEGHATYTNFRRFSVDTRVIIKEPE